MGSTFGFASAGEFKLSQEQITSFERDGFLHIPNVAPMDELEKLINSFEKLKQKTNELGKDKSDINAEYGKPDENTSGVSIMVPREYDPDLNGLTLEQRLSDIVSQLYGDNMVFAFDRFIAKKPGRKDAVFHWHQDKEYCDAHGGNQQLQNVKDDRVAVISVALDDTNTENGCIKYIRGSHKETNLRPHHEMHAKHEFSDKEKVLFKVTGTKVDENSEDVAVVPVKRAGITIHGNKIVHSSGGNVSNGWRRTYQIQFRSKEYIHLRNELGITRSFNK